MNSRERYRRAIHHQEPDRIPIDAGQDCHNGLHEVAYRNLLPYLGETDEIRRYDPVQHLAVVKESILDRLHVDTRYIFANAAAGYTMQYKADGSWLDEWGVRRKTCGLYDESVEHPLAGCSLQEVKTFPFPDPEDPARFAGLRERAEKMYRETDYALIGGSPASLFYLTSELVGFGEYLEKLVIEPRMIETLLDRVLDYFVRFFDKYLDAIGDSIEVVWLGDDWGTQMGPMISPKIFRDVFVPRYRDLIQAIKSKSRVKVALHSCGSVSWALDDFAAAGIDILHPLQGDAANMTDPAELKKKIDGKLVVYSNLPNQTTIPHGTPEEVVVEVQKRIQYLAPGGGYIGSAGHNIQADVKPENILAVFDTIYDRGRYPIGQHNHE